MARPPEAQEKFIAMPCHRYVVLLMICTLAGCGNAISKVTESPSSLTSAQAAAVDKAVRAFMQNVARDVTADGPIAWGKYFETGPAFFMAVNGKMAFPSGTAAAAALPGVAQTFKHIDLQWVDDLRIDPLTATLAAIGTSYHEVLQDASGHRIDANGYFTGVAEYQQGRWQFRNAHWSAPTATAP